MNKIAVRHLSAFVAVADEGSFGRAADRLYMSQPALSRVIASLEAEVGVPLLRRTTRRVELMPAGKVFLGHAKKMMDDLDAAAAEARRAAAGLIGTVRVAYMDFAILGALPELIASFRRAHPDIAVELQYSWTEQQKAELLASTLDVGFMIGPFHGPSVRAHTFDVQQYVAVLPEGHRLAAKAELRLEDLAHEPFIFGVAEEWAPHRQKVLEFCNRAGFAPAVAEEARSRDGILGFVAAGLGVAIYTDVAARSLRTGTVVVPIADIGDTPSVIAAWRERPSTPAKSQFVSFFLEWSAGYPR